MVSKDLFLDVHYVVSSWRVAVLHWIREFLRDYAPFDVARRLHYETQRRIMDGFLRITRDRWITDGVGWGWKPIYSWWWNATYLKWSPRIYF